MTRGPVRKAMILAAGRGKRMRPLTDSCPKPLLKIGETRLIEFHIQALKNAGIKELVINTAWLGGQIEETLGDGSQYGVKIEYSREGTALNTGGGIRRALPLLGHEPFILVNGDVWTDYPFENLMKQSVTEGGAHLVLVPNPEQHPEGDFHLSGGLISSQGEPKLTYSGIGLYDPTLFADLPEGEYPLAPILQQAMSESLISGESYSGHWYDVGRPERLKFVSELLERKALNTQES